MICIPGWIQRLSHTGLLWTLLQQELSDGYLILGAQGYSGKEEQDNLGLPEQSIFFNLLNIVEITL